jgi:hypothetical protein
MKFYIYKVMVSEKPSSKKVRKEKINIGGFV